MRTVNIAISNCIDCPYSEIRADYKETRGWPSYENKKVLCRLADFKEITSDCKEITLISQCHIPDFCPLLKKD
jgi:inhibitor of KinA sporulation pathway (predicted exonuclease)